MISRILNRVRKAIHHHVVVLMYHRVAELDTDPWQLAVSPKHFEQQLQVLKKYFRVISSSELNNQLRNHKIKADSVCITFDDGYVDNYKYAKPLLKKYHCPATFFISTSYIGKNRQFWWDELEKIILHAEELPGHISLSFGEQIVDFKLDERLLTDEMRRKHRSWNYLDPPPTQRCELYLRLWERIQPLSGDKIELMIEKIIHWATFTNPFRQEDLPMDRQQLKNMFDSSLFIPGIHTLNHQLLPAHPKEFQQREIVECRNRLEEWLGEKIDTLSYPYGNYDDNTLQIVAEEKIMTAFTTEETAIGKQGNPTLIGRFQVKNQSGPAFKKQLEHWFKYS